MLTPASFENRQTLLARLTVLRAVAIAGLALLAVGFWILQVPEHQKYLAMAQNNQLRTIPLRAPRGVLFDRHGKVLVQNDYSYTIAIVREQSPDPRDLSTAVRRLAAVTGADEERIAEVVRRHRFEASFRPIPVIEHATFEQVAAVMARKLELPEVVVQKVPTRSYPEGGFAAHLFGYVSEIRQTQLAQIEFAGLSPGAMVGQTGVERAYNSYLMGQDGARYVAVDSRGREVEERRLDDPQDGARLQLTLDYDLQRALETAYQKKGLAGAAVFLDPRNGEILAMTSQPEYDPNMFADGLQPEEWAQLTGDPDRPLQHRLIQGRYPPGSTFKALMAVAALSEGLITPDFRVTCNGGRYFYGHLFRCDKKEGHGSLDLRRAIEKSCDVYFYVLASLMNVDTIHRYAQLLGLSGKTGIDLPGEVESLVPSTEWKRRTTGDRWYPGETISVGIGQGQVSVTPMSLAVMISTIANGGSIVTPHVVKAVDLGEGWRDLTATPPRTLFQIPQQVLQPVHDGLWMVVNGAGTATGARVPGYDVSGKTGTAQVVSTRTKELMAGRSSRNLESHAWFEFYAPRGAPEIAGVVLAEHGGYGAQSAVPIAKFVLDTYFAKREGRPLPVWPEPRPVTPPAPMPVQETAEAR